MHDLTLFLPLCHFCNERLDDFFLLLGERLHRSLQTLRQLSVLLGQHGDLLARSLLELSVIILYCLVLFDKLLGIDTLFKDLEVPFDNLQLFVLLLDFGIKHGVFFEKSRHSPFLQFPLELRQLLLRLEVVDAELVFDVDFEASVLFQGRRKAVIETQGCALIQGIFSFHD